MLFDKIVEALNESKTVYYLLEKCYEDGCLDRDAVLKEKKAFQSKMTRLPDLITHESTEEEVLELIKRQTQAVRDATDGEKSFGDVFTSIIDDAIDRDYKWYGRYGKFWNEVELPYFVEDAFKAYVDSCLVGKVDGLRRCSARAVVGNAEYSTYDLSNIGILFDSEDSAMAFAEADGVDPSEISVCFHVSDDGIPSFQYL